MMDARILLVDDDPALLDALAEFMRLRIEGLRVDVCTSASVALEHVDAAHYDAIVSDIKMPDMDGLELLGEIRSRQPETPTLLITGHGDHELAIEALRAGAYDYITKPLDRDYFVASLKRAIECGRVRRDVDRRRAELERRAHDLEPCVHEAARRLRALLYQEWATCAELYLVQRRVEAATNSRRTSSVDALAGEEVAASVARYVPT